jgi:alpha-1,3-rhamnosyl/mannosyltransferase
VYLGVLDDSSWAAVLRGAAAFCYSTGYEGYGMPAIEAAASGTPIACSRVGSLPEVLNGAAAWSEDQSSETLGASLAMVLSDPQLAARLIADGIARVRTLPTWSDVAATTLSAYRGALAA